MAAGIPLGDHVSSAPSELATVALWHPIGRPVEEVLAWRDRLERLEIKQPYKQAHREVYLLTDAERRAQPRPLAGERSQRARRR